MSISLPSETIKISSDSIIDSLTDYQIETHKRKSIIHNITEKDDHSNPKRLKSIHESAVNDQFLIDLTTEIFIDLTTEEDPIDFMPNQAQNSQQIHPNSAQYSSPTSGSVPHSHFLTALQLRAFARIDALADLSEAHFRSALMQRFRSYHLSREQMKLCLDYVRSHARLIIHFDAHAVLDKLTKSNRLV